MGTIVENSPVLGLKTPMLVAEAGVKYTRPSGPRRLDEYRAEPVTPTVAVLNVTFVDGTDHPTL